MDTFKQIIIGAASAPQFAAGLFFAYITAFAMLLIRTTKRDINSPRTPFHFSWHFLLSDNLRRIVGNIILIFIGVRFLQIWISPEYVAYTGLFIGLVADQIARLFQFLGEVLGNLFRKIVASKVGD